MIKWKLVCIKKWLSFLVRVLSCIDRFLCRFGWREGGAVLQLFNNYYVKPSKVVQVVIAKTTKTICDIASEEQCMICNVDFLMHMFLFSPSYFQPWFSANYISSRNCKTCQIQCQRKLDTWTINLFLFSDNKFSTS